MRLRWLAPKRGDEFIRTACDSFTVARMHGPPDPPVYLAWKRRAIRGADGKLYPDIIGKFANSKDAMVFCEEFSTAGIETIKPGSAP